MDTEGEQIREVYAHFGLAAYFGQCLEVTLSNILIGNARIRGEAISVADIDALELANRRKTMGALINALRSKMSLPPDANQVIGEALDRRNFLIHHFFWERAVDFVCDQGRQRMLIELQEIQKRLQEADRMATSVCMSLLRYMGIDRAVIEAEYQRLRRGAD